MYLTAQTMNTYPALAEISAEKTENSDIVFNGRSSQAYIERNCKVLYVEDNIFNQALARQLFSKIGCNLEIAGNGYQALEMIIKESFDLIFMDINMPGLNGYETTSIIRKKLRLKLPILALTNCDSDEDIKMSQAVGMNEHLKKPLNEKQLTQTIIRWKKDSIDFRKFIRA
jgi:two-component system, sensor histidine kinase and response regulator